MVECYVNIPLLKQVADSLLKQQILEFGEVKICTIKNYGK
jgi:hypothetical protein